MMYRRLTLCAVCFAALCVASVCLADNLKDFNEAVNKAKESSPKIAEFIKQCDALAWQELPFGQPVQVPQVPLQALTETKAENLQDVLKFYLAQKLVQSRLFDEAETILNELTPDKTFDPCGVLLNRAVVLNQLGDTEKGKAALDAYKKEAEQFKELPRRYTELAKLLEFEAEQDKKNQQEENPEQIAKKMNDVRRRLGKGKTDDGTQDAEKDVMKSLDKLIKKIEDQQKQQGQQPGEGEGQQSNTPAEDSYRMGQKGPGNVDRKEFSQDGNWGTLPPKEREEALMKIEKEFPSHYREIIEQYFREMAGKKE
jgi:hypothetical protein